mgnify:CR=1 FL=1
MKNKKPMRMFLDSGAHSLFKEYIGTEAVRDFGFYESDKFWEFVDKYAEYIKSNEKLIDTYVNLDVIFNPELSWKVQGYLEKKHKLKPLPVYHAGEDLSWLKKYIERYDYVGIGGLGQSIGKVQWIASVGDPVFKIICDTKDHLPRVKTHGFAMTSPDLVLAYPWYCMTDKHKILTKRGWLCREEVRKGDLVLTYREGNSFWKPVLKVHEFDVNNVQIRRYSGRFSSETTLNHKWLTHNDKGIFKWKETDEFNYHDHIPRCAHYMDYPDTPIYSDEIVKLIAWVWTDGSISHTERSKNKGYVYPNISIYQCKKKNPTYVKQIRDLLKATNSIWNETIHKELSGGETVCFQLGGETKKLIGNILGCPKKLTFQFILSLTKKQIQIFLTEVWKGDGSISSRIKGDVFDFSQKKGKGIEAYKLACVLQGMPMSSYGHDTEYEHVLISNIKSYTPRNCKSEDVKYSGKIWCIEVENHTFFTQCEGAYYWTGNSVDSTSWMQFGKYGLIIVPKKVNGKLDYRLSPTIAIVSQRKAQKAKAEHFDNLPKQERNHIIEYIQSKGFKFGKSDLKKVPFDRKKCEFPIDDHVVSDEEIIIEEGVCNSGPIRDELNLEYYLDLEDHVPKYPWAWSNEGKQTRFPEL